MKKIQTVLIFTSLFFTFNWSCQSNSSDSKDNFPAPKDNIVNPAKEVDFTSQIETISTMLVVADLERSINFYTTIFDFKVENYEKGNIALLKLKNMQLYLIPSRGG